MFDIGNSWQAIENRAQKHHFSSTFSIRYVAYYEKMKSNGRVLPEAVPLMLTQIQITGDCSIAMQEILKTISGLMYCGRGDGSDFSVEVDQVTTNLQMLRQNFDFFSFYFLAIGLLSSKGRGNTIFSADFGNMLNCKPEYDAGIDLLTIQVILMLRQSLFSLPEPKYAFHLSIKIVNCPVIRGDTRVLFQSSSQQAHLLTSFPH